MCVHCLQVIGVASTQSSSALHQITRAYDVPSVTADKDLMVNICIMRTICTYVRDLRCMVQYIHCTCIVLYLTIVFSQSFIM